jgi:hypothetical protein
LKDNLPEIPTPPATCKAPLDVEVEAVVEVIAKPETFIIFVDGLKDIVPSLETAEPADNEAGVNKIG